MRRVGPDQQEDNSGSELQEGGSPGDQRSFAEVAATQKTRHARSEGHSIRPH